MHGPKPRMALAAAARWQVTEPVGGHTGMSLVSRIRLGTCRADRPVRVEDDVSDALHHVGSEGVPGGHLQEEDHPLLPVLVVLRDTEAVHHLLEGFHCRDREGSISSCPA